MDVERRRSGRRLVAVAVCAAALVACAIDREDHGVENCADVMSYREPVLTVTAVVGADGRPVGEVDVARYRQDGVPSLEQLRLDVESGTSWSPTRDVATSDSGLHAGLSLEAGGQVTCTVPCAFGSSPGTVDLTLLADGGQRATRSIAVDYDGREPGCGGALTGGTDLVVRLTRTPAGPAR